MVWEWIEQECENCGEPYEADPECCPQFCVEGYCSQGCAEASKKEYQRIEKCEREYNGGN